MSRKKKTDSVKLQKQTDNTISTNPQSQQEESTIIPITSNPPEAISSDTLENVVVAKSKRGRKPKNAQKTESTESTESTEGIATTVNIDGSETTETAKMMQNMLTIETTENVENIVLSHIEDKELIDELNDEEKQTKAPGKKRGRKPKGGKIIQQVLITSNIKESKPNVILHLKCSMKDLHHNLIENNINGYNFSSCKKEMFYEIITNNNNNNNNNSNNNYANNYVNNYESNSNLKIQNEDYFKNDTYETESCDNDSYVCNKKNDLRDLWKKIKNLEYNLHLNNISDKKSACFWCTYDFDNPPIYIPKHFIKDTYHVYGCFCSPECAAAFLMEESIDSSTKFERYHLLNHIYSKIYEYTKNIKPAPKPHYLLEKFYGNLNIQEYRSLLKNDRLFLVVDKPLTRILPELHEDNDDFIINNKIIPSNSYQIKKKLNKQTKHTILNEKFGLQNNS